MPEVSSNPRPRGALAGALVFVALAGLVAAEATYQLLRTNSGEGFDVVAVAFVTFPVVGVLIAFRQPRNVIAWIMIGVGLTSILDAALRGYAYYALEVRPGTLAGAGAALAVDQLLWIPVIGLPGTFLILLFPDGRPPSAGWRRWGYFCAFTLIICFAALIVVPTSFAGYGYPDVRNPLAIGALEPYAGVLVSTVALIPVAIVGCAVALIQRFRRARGLARVQLKWLASAGGVVATTYMALMVVHLLFDDGSLPRWFWVASDAGIAAFALIPVAVGVAILRHRLYDIDVIINRTLVYGALTATLTVAYLVAVTGLQGLLRPFAGQSQLAVAGSTLLVAAAFRPARVRIQRFVDRRFYRAKFDADATVARFSARVREGVELETLTADLLAAVDQTMKPAGASLWLRPEAPARGAGHSVRAARR